jgi:hypothetical protein
MNITGTWKGEYIFEEMDEKEGGGKYMAGQVVNFTMTLKQGWLGMVSGTVQDDARAGFPEKGAVKGRVKKNEFGFRKLMPVMRMIHENSRLTLEQWADRHKMVMDTNRGHPAILHMGEISADGETMEGRWRVSATSIEVPGSYQQLQLPTMGGSWTMARQK